MGGDGRDDSERIDAEARRWFVRLTSPDASDADIARFEAWRETDPRHPRAYDRITAVWRDLEQIGRSPSADALRRSVAPTPLEQATAAIGRWWAGRPDRFGRPAVAAWGALAAAVLIAVLLVRPFELSPPGFDGAAGVVATRTAEVRDQLLADGSAVTLGARSRLQVAFSDTERRVSLVAGQAFFSVVRDAQRPFIVTAGGTEVRVLGTKFDVHMSPSAVRVSVLEGQVRVAPGAPPSSSSPPPAPSRYDPVSGPGPEARVLTAGQEVVATIAGDLAQVRVVGAGVPGTWRQGRLVYKDAPLIDVVSDVNRYYEGEIVLASADLHDLRITTAFQVDQIDQMIETLAVALPVQVDRVGGNRVVVRPRPEAG